MSELEPTRTYSNPTATDELLTLLKEHGVEHYEHEAPATDCIAFFDGRGWHDCWESVDGEVNVTFSMTPEQAIAATLGATDAKPTQVESSGTCHVECFDDGIDEALDGSPIYTTPTWYLSCGHTCEGAERPSFCPNCGRKVVEPTTNDVGAEVDA